MMEEAPADDDVDPGVVGGRLFLGGGTVRSFCFLGCTSWEDEAADGVDATDLVPLILVVLVLVLDRF